MPTFGVLECECKDKTGNIQSSSIVIDKNVNYYTVDGNAKLMAGPVDTEGKCKTLGCPNCICQYDSDCVRFGCGKCIGGKCA